MKTVRFATMSLLTVLLSLGMARNEKYDKEGAMGEKQKQENELGQMGAQDTEKQKIQLGTIENVENVPKYWISDASIFLNSAATTAAIMEEQSNLDSLDSAVILSQAKYLSAALDRSIEDLQKLKENAQQVTPEGDSAIDQTVSSLEDARSHLDSLEQVAQAGELEQNYDQKVSAVRQGLQQAQQDFQNVGQAFDALAYTQMGGAGAAAGRPETQEPETMQPDTQEPEMQEPDMEEPQPWEVEPESPEM
jgi:acyl carrier protein